MPAEKGDKKAISVWIDKELDKRIEELAEKGGLTKSKFLSNLIEVGVEEVWAANKIGVWALARVFEDFRLKTQKKIKKVTTKS